MHRAGTMRATDQTAVRAHNLAAVAAFIRQEGHARRRQLGESLGLNKATVSSLVAELVARGLIAEGARLAPSEPGRPASTLQLDRTAHSSLVAEVFADRVALSTWTLSAERLDSDELPLCSADLDSERAAAVTATAMAAAVNHARSGGRLLTGVVVALPGLIDTANGVVIASEPLGWADVRLRDAMAAHDTLRDARIEFMRIANLAAVAESRRLPEHRDLICLHSGETGIGAGLVLDGRLVTGSHGRAGELFFPQARDRRQPFVPALSIEAAHELAKESSGASHARSAQLSSLLDAITTRLATLVALLDPTGIVLSGHLAALGEEFAKQVERKLKKSLPPGHPGEAAVILGTHGSDAAAVGGALLLADIALSLDTGA